MGITIKELNQEQIRQANYNSFGGKRGDISAHEYEMYCNRVVSWGLSEKKTQQIIDKVYTYFSKSLSLESRHVSVAVSAAFCEWFEDIERQVTRKPYSRIGWLVKQIIWGVNGDYSVNKEWKELAGRSRKDFEILYDELSKRNEFKKTSIPFKIHNNLIEVEKITQTPIYADGDFMAYEELGKVCIDFRLKPQRQMIVALKARHFTWVASHGVWKASATEDVIEWVKTIAERYEQYI